VTTPRQEKDAAQRVLVVAPATSSFQRDNGYSLKRFIVAVPPNGTADRASLAVLTVYGHDSVRLRSMP
jgi:hypothetical protein